MYVVMLLLVARGEYGKVVSNRQKYLSTALFFMLMTQFCLISHASLLGKKNTFTESESIVGPSVALYPGKYPYLDQSLQKQELIDVTGLVQDSMKTPIAGVVVREVINGRATRKATKTNELGIFLLKGISKEAFLAFSHVGYQVVRVEAKASMEPITLKLLESTIEEVVVTGIFERSKESFTGAVRTITAEDIRKTGNQNVLTALTLLEPSIQAVQNLVDGSDPNSLVDLRLRGSSNLPNTSVAAAGTGAMDVAYGNRVQEIANQYTVNPNLPLFILDGFEAPLNRINDLDINEVKSMTVLKDASATAIYGSRGANGVIVVERFKPKAGGVNFKYYADITYEAPDLSAYQLLNAEQKLRVEQLAGVYDQEATNVLVDLQETYSLRLREVLRGRDTYWPAIPLRNAFNQRHRVAMEGGAGDMTYGINFTYNANPGVMKGSARNVYNGESFLSYRNAKFQLSNRLNIQVTDAIISPWGRFSAYTDMNPYFSPYDENGDISLLLQAPIADYQNDVYQEIYNPVYNTTLNGRNLTKSRNLTNNTVVEYRFSPNLSLRGRVSITAQTDDSEIFLPAEHTSFRQMGDILNRGSLAMGDGNLFSYDANVDLNYNVKFGAHQIFSTLNARLHENTNENVVVQVRGLPSSLTDYAFYARAYAGSRPTGSESTIRQAGFLGNFNYTYDNRYFADFSYRLDGSSSVGSDRLFSPFGSLGVGWNLHREDFLKDAVQHGFIDELRLRTSFGLTGVQQYQPYDAIRTYSYFLDDTYVNSVGARLLGVGNNNLTWQTTQKYNVGLNLTMLDNRINVVADYYYDFTDGFTTQFSLPPSSGFNTYTGNLGSIISTGFETSLSLMAVKPQLKNGFGLTLTANVGNNKSTINEITEELRTQNERLLSQTTSTMPLMRYQEGESLNAIWVVPSLGVDPANGQELFVKQDGTTTYEWRTVDARPLGISMPKFRGTLGFNLYYAGFQLNAYFSYRYGGQLYNTTLVNKVENVNLVDNADVRVFLDRWQQPGDMMPFRALSYDGTQRSDTNATSRFLQDDNLLTLSSASLLYRFDNELIKRIGLRTLNLGLYMNDVFQLSSIQIERGTAYPFARSVSFSLQTSF